MRTFFIMALLLTCTSVFSSPRVVVSIKPIHDLVSAVMAGVDEPTLLVPVGSSPHDYALAPSQSAALAQADLIIWVSPQLEIFLVNTMANYPDKNMMLNDLPHLVRYETRDMDHWGKDTDIGSTLEGHNKHVPIDPHLWLAPKNAIIILQQVAQVLSERDPANASIYQENTVKAVARIAALDSAIMASVKSFQKRPYIVYHDAYQYFERSFGTKDLGSVTLHPDIPPTAARLALLNEVLKKNKVRCIFTEPQLKMGVVEGIAQQYGLKVGLLDPMGTAELSGVAAYEALLNHMADNMKSCLM